MLFTEEKDFADHWMCRRAQGTDGSLFINKLCNKASQGFGLTVSRPGGVLSPTRQLREGVERPSAGGASKAGPGHWLPGGSQAPEAIRSFNFSSLLDQTLACWRHAANASADFPEWCVGI